MSELPLSSKYRTDPDAPVDDDERADLADRLATEFTSGRLPQDAYLAQLDLVYRAERLGDLVPVVAGLPPRSTHNVPDIVLQGNRLPGTVSKGKNIVPIVAGAAAGLFLVLGIVVVLLALMIL